MRRKIISITLAFTILALMVIPAMATTWKSYSNKYVSSLSSAQATTTITKENSSFTYCTFSNTDTYAQTNTTYKTSITMKAWAGSSGTNTAASATVSYGGQKNATFGSGYGGTGTSYRLGLYNSTTSDVISNGRWTPY